VGALVWSEWGIVMGAPYATPVEAFDPARKAILFQGPWYNDSGDGIATNHRYWLEDKPQYLDRPGEYWFDRQGEGGRLYVRLPGDANPATVVVEAARHTTLIDGRNVSHIDVSGLTFRFGNIWWNLQDRTFAGDVETAAVRFQGSGTGLSVRHCVFGYMAKAVRIAAAGGPEAAMDAIRICDNDIAHTDHGAIDVVDGTGWGQQDRPASLGRVEILRNRIRNVGFRPYRPNGHHTLHVNNPEVAEIAGNMLHRLGGAGIFVFGGKASSAAYDEPFGRILIHHNKVTDALLIANDWGAVETWQGGPCYVYNNVAGNPVGPMNWTGSRWTGAYYLDGGFKNYHFNNIAWGKANDPADTRKASVSGFQEIHGYQCTFFNNTLHRSRFGSNRQSPVAGRNKYMGNIFHDISEYVFRHSDKRGIAPNARDAGAQDEHFAYALNAYARNVFSAISGKFGPFEATGGDYPDLASFAAALSRVKALASDVGVMAERCPLRDPDAHDFRLRPDSAAVDGGVKAFVPWSLYAVVGEWPFTPNREDPSEVIDEAWYMKEHFVNRARYHAMPTFPLRAENVSLDDYVPSPTENWAKGALRLDGKTQGLTLKNVIRPEAPGVELVEHKNRSDKTHSAAAGVEKTDPVVFFDPQVDTHSFLAEAYFKAEPGAHGLLIGKGPRHGWMVALDRNGHAVFGVGKRLAKSVKSRARLSEGAWHHLIAECDRANRKLNLYVDGRKDADAPGIGPEVSLATDRDLRAGRMACTLDFLRLCRGTLADAHTTIEELYAWQFSGPFLRDFCGNEPAGRRDAGALESTEPAGEQAP
jgi:hypothetical protein